MRTRILASLTLIIFFFGLFFLLRTDRVTDDKLTVVCTTSMLADAVERIGGKYVRVHGLMGAGVDPHLYRARESDVHKFVAADLIVYNGLHLEGKLADVLSRMRSYTPTVAVADCLAQDVLIPTEFTDVYDPHIWHDVQLWVQVVAYVAEQLGRVDPEHKHEYQHNAMIYKQELVLLDEYVKMRARTVPAAQRVLVTAHDAFAYFGRAYGFEVVGLQGISTETQIGAHDVQQLADYIVAKKLRAIFVESSVPQRTLQAVQQAVRARGWSVAIGDYLLSDALGTPGTPEGTYAGMVRYNVDVITRALTS